MTRLAPTPEEAARELKLPDWAQKTINGLRASAGNRLTEANRLQTRVDELEEQVIAIAKGHAGPEDSDAFLWRQMPGGEELAPLGLGACATVEFRPNTVDGVVDAIEVNVKGNGIRVHSGSNLMVIPFGRGDYLIQAVNQPISNR
jgi:hypothetical protein